MSDIAPYNPLDKRHLGESVADALLARPVEKLGSLVQFQGAGIYAIYYSGSFAPYAPIAKANSNGAFVQPIYVGKAVPKGARRGANLEAEAGQVLYDRLREHADSLGAADNMDLGDFHCRNLVLDDVWIPLGETLVISKFSPLWNLVVDGFGNHDPGKGRRKGKRSMWDTVHPGRPWAKKLKPRKETLDQLAQNISEWLKAGGG